MISTTSDVLDPTGSQRLTTVRSDSAVITEVAASSSGMPAAISAPDTGTSRTSVTGREVAPALRKPLPSTEVMARPWLASPPPAIRRPGYRAWTAATARSAGATAVTWSAAGPGTWNVTRALRPSAETSPDCPPRPRASGERMSVAARGRRARPVGTSRAAWCIPRPTANATARPPPVSCRSRAGALTTDRSGGMTDRAAPVLHAVFQRAQRPGAREHLLGLGQRVGRGPEQRARDGRVRAGRDHQDVVEDQEQDEEAGGGEQCPGQGVDVQANSAATAQAVREVAERDAVDGRLAGVPDARVAPRRPVPDRQGHPGQERQPDPEHDRVQDEQRHPEPGQAGDVTPRVRVPPAALDVGHDHLPA